MTQDSAQPPKNAVALVTWLLGLKKVNCSIPNTYLRLLAMLFYCRQTHAHITKTKTKLKMENKETLPTFASRSFEATNLESQFLYNFCILNNTYKRMHYIETSLRLIIKN